MWSHYLPTSIWKKLLRAGVRKITPEENCPPPSEAGFGLQLALELGLGAIFLGGNFLRTLRAISMVYSPIILIVVN